MFARWLTYLKNGVQNASCYKAILMKQLPNFLILFVFVLLFAAPYRVVAQQSGAKATVSIDTARILVGDQVGMKLQFNFPKGARIDWPIKADTVIKGINIVKASGIDSLP